MDRWMDGWIDRYIVAPSMGDICVCTCKYSYIHRSNPQVGIGVKVTGGPLLASMLAEARKPQPKIPFCAAMQYERRLARARRHSPRRKQTGPLIRQPLGGPDSGVLLTDKRDARSAINARRSALAEAMGKF